MNIVRRVNLSLIHIFPQESFDTVFIILDKMDKIGLEGVAEELEKEGFAKESIDTYLGLFKEITSDIEGVRYCKEKLKDVLDPKLSLIHIYVYKRQ